MLIIPSLHPHPSLINEIIVNQENELIIGSITVLEKVLINFVDRLKKKPIVINFMNNIFRYKREMFAYDIIIDRVVEMHRSESKNNK